MAKHYDFDVPASPTKTYEALRRAVAELGYELQRADGRSLSIQFRAKRTLMAGRVAMSAMVVEAAECRSKLSITGKPAGREMTAWGEEGKVANELFAKATSILPQIADAKPRPSIPATSRPATQPRTGGADFIAELERLAALHASGAIDDGEFKLAKSSLLAAPPPASTGAPVAAAAQATPGSSSGAGTGKLLGAAAAGVAGGMLFSDAASASPATAPTGEPVTEHIRYDETFTTPDGETVSVEGEINSTVTFDESGDAHVEIHDQGSMDVNGETFDYESDIEGDVDLGGDLGGDDGGLLDGLFS